MTKFNELNTYSYKEYTELFIKYISVNISSPSALKAKFQTSLSSKIEAFHDPIVLSNLDVEQKMDDASQDIWSYMNINLNEDVLYQLISDEFKSKCAQGVIMSDELDYIQKVTEKFAEMHIDQYYLKATQAKKAIQKPPKR